MATVVKITTDSEGGVPVDTVESLLAKAREGVDLIVFIDTGSILYVNTDIGDETHEFEEV